MLTKQLYFMLMKQMVFVDAEQTDRLPKRSLSPQTREHCSVSWSEASERFTEDRHVHKQTAAAAKSKEAHGNVHELSASAEGFIFTYL